MNIRQVPKKHLYPLLSFVASLFGITLIFAIAGIPPFGQHSLLSMDAWSQYFPMLLEGQDGLSQWSFSGALGFNRLAQSAYYTMSPLWWLLYLFPRSWMYTVLHLIIALRFALAGLTCYLFLAKRYRPSPAGIAFSLAYSLSAYPLAFLNQFMWMDAVVLLPLVALGLELLCKEKRPLLYVAALSLTLYSCFYIGYMVCLFSVLYFLSASLREKRKWGDHAKNAGLFSAFSLLSGGLAAFVLLPTFLCLRTTIASGLGFDGELRLYHSFWDILRQFLPFGKISLEYQAPNLYCGVLCLLLAAFSLFSPKKSWRERILLLLGAILVYFSCTLNLFDFVWHGMHYPNQLPGRQSFIFIFLIVGEAYSALLALREIKWRKSNTKGVLTAVLALLLSTEVVASGAYTVATQTWTCRVSDYAYWDEPMEYIAATYSDGPWRSEKISSFNFNAGQLYRYNGISYYSSTMSSEAYHFFTRIGMDIYALNVSTLYKPTNILNMLFGVRYLHGYNADIAENLYLDLTEVVGNVTVYENRYCLPLAFSASRDAAALDIEGMSGSWLQNEMLRTLLGDPKGITYRTESEISAAYDRLAQDGLQITDFSNDHIVGTVHSDGDTLLYTSIPADKGWAVYIDGERAETVTLFGFLMGVELDDGEHTVEMRYTAPGFTAGLTISLFSAAAVALYAIYDVKHRRKAK